MGLHDSQHIAKIWIDPRDSNVVLVASQGPLFSAGGDRGLYRSTDGGQTWQSELRLTPSSEAETAFYNKRVGSATVRPGPFAALADPAAFAALKQATQPGAEPIFCSGRDRQARSCPA